MGNMICLSSFTDPYPCTNSFTFRYTHEIEAILWAFNSVKIHYKIYYTGGNRLC